MFEQGRVEKREVVEQGRVEKREVSEQGEGRDEGGV